MVYTLNRQPDYKSPWRFGFYLLVVASIIGWLYVLDYVGIIDVPRLDNAYDGKPVTENNNQIP